MTRYEKLWLPLLAGLPPHQVTDQVPPLDIHWVWHCHLLSPRQYESDCRLITQGKVLDHCLPNNIKKGLKRSEKLWSCQYPDEPFHADLNAQHTAPYSQRSIYNLEEAISRQRAFFYQVSLPHYTTEKYLKLAVKRYKKFLHLKKLYPLALLAPCYDFDLVWHSHQLHHSAYVKDTSSLLGVILNHDDSINDRSPGSRLDQANQAIQPLWRRVYGDSFFHPGGMYRGPPPSKQLVKVSEADFWNVSSTIQTHCVEKGPCVLNLVAGSFESNYDEDLGQLLGPVPSLNFLHNPYCKQVHHLRPENHREDIVASHRYLLTIGSNHFPVYIISSKIMIF